MAVKVVFGMTQSGKSHHVEQYILKERKRVFVFDVINCFKHLTSRHPLDERNGLDCRALESAWIEALRAPDRFRVGFVPSRTGDYVRLFDKLITTSLLLGDKLKDHGENLLMVCDESNEVTSATARSARLRELVSRGRHYGVDSLFIAQRPEMLHNDIKANASEVVAFNLNSENSFFRTVFGKDIAEKIKTLPKYHYAYWNNTGKTYFANENGKKYEERG